MTLSFCGVCGFVGVLGEGDEFGTHVVPCSDQVCPFRALPIPDDADHANEHDPSNPKNQADQLRDMGGEA